METVFIERLLSILAKYCVATVPKCTLYQCITNCWKSPPSNITTLHCVFKDPTDIPELDKQEVQVKLRLQYKTKTKWLMLCFIEQNKNVCRCCVHYRTFFF